MLKVGILSDTHSCFDDKLKRFFDNVDELWHAGDIGSLNIINELTSFKPIYAVHGNIDDTDVRKVYPEVLHIKREQTNVLMKHITGYPGRYEKKVVEMIKETFPHIVVGGHSHILKVMYDKQFNVLYINPGAAGKSGFHQVRTAIRLVLNDDKFSDMEVGEWSR